MSCPLPSLPASRIYLMPEGQTVSDRSWLAPRDRVPAAAAHKHQCRPCMHQRRGCAPSRLLPRSDICGIVKNQQFTRVVVLLLSPADARRALSQTGASATAATAAQAAAGAAALPKKKALVLPVAAEEEAAAEEEIRVKLHRMHLCRTSQSRHPAASGRGFQTNLRHACSPARPPHVPARSLLQRRGAGDLLQCGNQL